MSKKTLRAPSTSSDIKDRQPPPQKMAMLGPYVPRKWLNVF